MVAPAIDLALCSVLILKNPLFDHCYRYWIFQLTVNGALLTIILSYNSQSLNSRSPMVIFLLTIESEIDSNFVSVGIRVFEPTVKQVTGSNHRFLI